MALVILSSLSTRGYSRAAILKSKGGTFVSLSCFTCVNVDAVFVDRGRMWRNSNPEAVEGFDVTNCAAARMAARLQLGL